MMIKSLVKSAAIYAAAAVMLISTGKMLATGIGTLIDSSRDLNDAMNYAITAIVDDDDVK